MHLKKNLASILTTLLLLSGTASFAQDNTIFMDENTFNESLNNAGGSLESLSQGLMVLSDGASNENVNAPELIPIDGGLGILLAAGLGYGARRLRKQKENRKTDPQ